jgi:hypothetical protein
MKFIINFANMKTQIDLNEASENSLAVLKKVAIINDRKSAKKEDLILLAIELAEKTINNSDDETLINLTGLKKTI